MILNFTRALLSHSVAYIGGWWSSHRTLSSQRAYETLLCGSLLSCSLLLFVGCSIVSPGEQTVAPPGIMQWLHVLQAATREEGLFADLPADQIMVPDVTATYNALMIYDRLSAPVENAATVQKWLAEKSEDGVFQLRYSHLPPAVFTATLVTAFRLAESGEDNDHFSELLEEIDLSDRLPLISSAHLGLPILYETILESRDGVLVENLVAQDALLIAQELESRARGQQCGRAISGEYHEVIALLRALDILQVDVITDCARNHLLAIVNSMSEWIDPYTDTSVWLRDICLRYCDPATAREVAQQLAYAASTELASAMGSGSQCTTTTRISIIHLQKLSAGLSEADLNRQRSSILGCLSTARLPNGWLLQPDSPPSIWATYIGLQILSRFGPVSSQARKNAREFATASLQSSVRRDEWHSAYRSALLLESVGGTVPVDLFGATDLVHAADSCKSEGNIKCFGNIAGILVLTRLWESESELGDAVAGCGTTITSETAMDCIYNVLYALSQIGRDSDGLSTPALSFSALADRGGAIDINGYKYRKIGKLSRLLWLSEYTSVGWESTPTTQSVIAASVSRFGCSDAAVQDPDQNAIRYSEHITLESTYDCLVALDILSLD